MVIVFSKNQQQQQQKTNKKNNNNNTPANDRVDWDRRNYLLQQKIVRLTRMVMCRSRWTRNNNNNEDC
jgi:hypothetical protein